MTPAQVRRDVEAYLVGDLWAQSRRPHRGRADRWYTFPSSSSGFVRVETFVRRNGVTDLGVDRGGRWLPEEVDGSSIHPALSGEPIRATYSHAVVPSEVALSVLRAWIPLELRWAVTPA